MHLSHKAHAQLALVQSPVPPTKPKKYDTNEQQNRVKNMSVVT